MNRFIIGTAGHIDHGKTTLIRALTGRNTTERWREMSHLPGGAWEWYIHFHTADWFKTFKRGRADFGAK